MTSETDSLRLGEFDARCEQCTNARDCRSKQGFNRHVEHYSVSTLHAYVDLTTTLRHGKYLSFRGQRDKSWSLGIGYKYEKLPLPERIDGHAATKLTEQDRVYFEKFYSNSPNGYELKNVTPQLQRFGVWSLLRRCGVLQFDLETQSRSFRLRHMELPKHDYIQEHDELRWLFHAQHHGLITRLLDWTSNPLVALYFAVENITARVSDPAVAGCVWAVKVADEYFQQPEEIGPPGALLTWRMINPPPITVRLSRQSGKFSYHPSIDEEEIFPVEVTPWRRPLPPLMTSAQVERLRSLHGANVEGVYSKVGELWKLNGARNYGSCVEQRVIDAVKMLQNAEREEREASFVKICIVDGPHGRSTASRIREELGFLNVHRASLFPDADGIAQFINYELPTLEPRPQQRDALAAHSRLSE